ncbi:hypothetical protein GCM10027213_49510 [Mycobacterium bourgelatii]
MTAANHAGTLPQLNELSHCVTCDMEQRYRRGGGTQTETRHRDARRECLPALAFPLMPLIEWLGTIPEGIWGGIIGVAGAQLLTWVRERRRNRDAYRAPQRDAIATIITGADTMKVALSDALEHMGVGGRQTSDDAAAQSLNNFLTALLALDQKFAVGRLTIVDGPCRDKMITAYLEYSKLRDFANKKLPPSRAGFTEFLRRMSETSNALDKTIGELVDLAEARLRPSRPMLSKRSTLSVATNRGHSAGDDGDGETKAPQPQR